MLTKYWEMFEKVKYIMSKVLVDGKWMKKLSLGKWQKCNFRK